MERPESETSSVECLGEVIRPSSPFSSGGDSDDDSVKCLGEFPVARSPSSVRCDIVQNQVGGNNNNNVSEWVHAYWPGSPVADSMVNIDDGCCEVDENHLAVTISDGGRRSPTPYPFQDSKNAQSVETMDGSTTNQESLHLPPNAGNASEDEAMVYDRVLSDPKEPTARACCGHEPLICQCVSPKVWEVSQFVKARPPTPYPTEGAVVRSKTSADGATKIQEEEMDGEGDSDKENEEPASGRSTSLGESMDWSSDNDVPPVCVTPELEYTPGNSPPPGQPPKRRQLALKPSLVSEYRPTEPAQPTAPPASVQSLAANASGNLLVTSDLKIHPLVFHRIKVDGFHIVFSNGSKVSVNGLTLNGVNMRLVVMDNGRVMLHFTQTVGNEMQEEVVIPYNSGEVELIPLFGQNSCSLYDVKMELGFGYEAAIDIIYTKGVSFVRRVGNGEASIIFDMD